MRAARRIAPVLVVLLLAGACASVGGGDAVVVRAEDALTNSLAVYSSAMNWHFKHSTQESPAVYKTFEAFRVKFPVAWTALDNAKRSYQKDKSGGTGALEAGINALVELLSTVKPLIGGA